MDLNSEGGAGEGGADFGGSADLLGGSGGGGAADGGGGAGGGGEGGGGAADPDWYEGLSTEVAEGRTSSNRDVVKAKGWRTLDDVVASYREAERAVRDSGRVKVPGEGASAEEVAAYHRAIGVPEKAEDYAVPEFKDADGNPIEINTALTERIAQFAHKHGMPKGALEAVLHDEIAAQIAEYDAIVADREKAAGAHVKAWGEEREAKLANIDAAARDIGLSRQDMEYLRGMPSGVGKALDMLAKFGSNFGEDTLIRGEKRSFGMTGGNAQAEIDAIKADPATFDKAMVPGTPENARYTRALEALAADADKRAAGG